MSRAPFDFLAEAGKLVRFNTVTWSSNAECAVYVGSLLRRLGLEVVYQESREGGSLFMNVVGMGGAGKDPLLLATHLDTVPAGPPRLWTKTKGDPWKLAVKGQTLYGLGAADTKLDLLCKLTALGRLTGFKWKRPVLVLGTFGEESGLRGAARFCQGEFPRPAAALVGEPTGLSLVTRHKGLMVMEVSFRSRGLYRPEKEGWAYEAAFTGRAAHSSTPALGENALSRSMEFLAGLRKRFGKVTVLSWEGGESHNMIPAAARLRFALGDRPKAVFPAKRRLKVKADKLPGGWYSTLPWEESFQTMETLASILVPMEKERDRAFEPDGLTWNLTRMTESKEGWNLAFDFRSLPGQALHRVVKKLEEKLWKRLGPPGKGWQFRVERDNPPLETDEKGTWVRQARSALKAAKIPFRLAAKSGCSEAGLYSRVGIPSLVFGPGRSAGNIHRPNESVSLAQIRAAARFYEAFLRRACS